MKANLSVDMEYRTNLRIDYRLDKAQVTNLLAMHVAIYGDGGEKLTEKRLLELVRKQLMYQGMDALDFGSQDGIDDETLEWAKEQVGRFWKEEL